MKKKLLFFLKKNYRDVFVVLLCLIYSVLFSLIAINRFWQYEVFYYDFGIFDQAIWNVSQFKAPIIDHFVLRGKWIFADHFNPTIFLLSPFYWLTTRSEMVLIMQAFSIGISGVLLYYIGRIVTKNRLFFSASITCCYLLFIGIQNALITDFHEVTLAAPFLMSCYLAILKKNKALFFLFFLLFLGVKESNFLLGTGIGISIFLLDKHMRKTGIITCIVSALWGFLAIHFIIPHFSGGTYIYNTPVSISPFDYIHALYDNPDKRYTAFFSFVSFGFLPLLSPFFWIAIFLEFLSRFYPPFLQGAWRLTMHYNVLTGGILAIASMFSYRNVKRIVPSKLLIVLSLTLICVSLFLHRFYFHGPLGLAFNSAFYHHSKDFTFLDTLIKKVPKNVSVMAQNNIAPHLTHQHVFLLHDNCKSCTEEYYRTIMPDYILIDNRAGQNPNDFYGVASLASVAADLKNDRDYTLTYHANEQYIFKHK